MEKAPAVLELAATYGQLSLAQSKSLSCCGNRFAECRHVC
jgi:hypothetical protein